MKKVIKKLTVLMIVAALALFMSMAMASAAQPVPHAIRGEYAFTGTGNCLISPTGFTNYTPNDPTQAFISTLVINGVYTFKRNGTGAFQQEARFLDTPPGAINIAKETWPLFNYKPTDRDRFTIYWNQGSYMEIDWIAGPNTITQPPSIFFEIDGNCDGTVSQSMDTVTITCGDPVLILTLCDPSKPPCTPIPSFQAYCSFSQVGTRVDK
jgi:hypothetical protein